VACSSMPYSHATSHIWHVRVNNEYQILLSLTQRVGHRYRHLSKLISIICLVGYPLGNCQQPLVDKFYAAHCEWFDAK